MGLKVKYTIEDIREKFGLSNDEIRRFIESGLLLPVGWDNVYDADILELDCCTWHIDVIAQFDKIRNLIKDRYLTIFQTLNSRLNDVEINLIKKSDIISGKITNLRSDFIKFRCRLERKELMIDSMYFCEITGYTTNYFRKRVNRLDKEGLIMRLMIPFYKSLIWHKIKGRWVTPFIDFEELRKNFRYEIYIEELKRKGTFTPRLPKIDKDLFKILSDKDIKS